jgi:hypothetical protein
MRSVAFESREAVRSDLALERSRTKNADMPSLNFMVGIAQSPTYPLRKKTGNARREDTARFDHALDFMQKRFVVWDVLKHLRADHPIESGIRERKSSTIAFDEGRSSLILLENIEVSTTGSRSGKVSAR